MKIVVVAVTFDKSSKNYFFYYDFGGDDVLKVVSIKNNKEALKEYFYLCSKEW